jgi:DeoR/GlpR family transcriptional regulator of sugar metabolism
MTKGESRRQAIVEQLKTVPMIPVAELATSLQVTMETIRKDLAILEENGTVVRIHGGAALAEGSGTAIPYDLRKSIHKEGKRQVAKAACGLINPGESILLEGSTTIVALCQELLEKEELLKTLTIVTNSFYIAQLFELGNLCQRFFFLGGWSASGEGATQGNYTAESIQRFNVNCAFLSGAALSKELHLSAYYEHDMYFQQSAIRSARKTAVLLNNSKFPASGLFMVDDMSGVDYLVTDAVFSERETQMLTQKDVLVVRDL